MMRWALLALLLVGWASPAWATFAEVGGGTQRAGKISNFLNSDTLSFPASVTAGNVLVVWGAAFADGAAPTTISVTDSQGSYSVTSCDDSAFTGTVRSFIAWRIATASGANTVTVDPAGSLSFFSFTIDEFSIAGGNVPTIDATGACTSGSSTTPSGTIAPVSANTLVLGVFMDANSTTAITPGGSYTQAGEQEDATLGQVHNAVFRITTTAQTYTVNWTAGTTVNWTVFAIALREGVVDTTAPTSPTGLTCTAQSSSSDSCTWSASTDNVGVVDYVLDRSPAGCASFATIATPVVTNYTDTGRAANTTYCYRVSARDGSSNVSIPSGTTNVTTMPTRQATLTWTNNGTYTTVIVERCVGTGCSSFADYATVSGSLTTYVDAASATPVSGYRVRATLSGASDSVPSNIVYTTPLTPAVLSIAPPSLTYGATIGAANPPAQALTISNTSGSQVMNWTVTDDAAWVSCTPAAGTDTTVLSCSVNITGLSSGTQFATITITAPGATGSPQTVVVTLNLAPANTGGTPPGQGRSGRVR